MTTIQQELEYDVLADSLSLISDYCSLSYIHGILTAYHCVKINFDVDDWLESQIAKNLSTRMHDADPASINLIRETLARMNNLVLDTLEEQDMGFNLILPDDEEEIAYRTLALADWSRGFIEIFESKSANMNLSEDAKEAIEYIKEIIDIDNDNEGTESDEKYFFEISEYIRLAAILLFLELRLASKNKTEKVLH